MKLNWSLAIYFTIVLVVTRLPATGFIIRKIDNFDETTDLVAEESSLLEVKSDLNGYKVEKVINNGNPDQTSSDTVIALTYLKHQPPTETNTIKYIATETSTAISDSQSETLTADLSVNMETTRVLPQAVTKPTLASTSSNISLDIIGDTLTSATTPSSRDLTIEHNESIKIETITTLQNVNATKSDRYNSDVNLDKNTNDTQIFKYNDSLATSTNPVEGIVFDSKSLVNLVPTDRDILTIEHTTDNIAPTETNKDAMDATTIEGTNYERASLSVSDQIKSFKNNEENSMVVVEDFTLDTEFETTTDMPSTYVTLLDITEYKVDDESATTTLPPWKHYKTINRRRKTTTSIENALETSPATVTETEIAQAGSARSVLENLLGHTPIPSLMKLKNDLLNVQEPITEKNDRNEKVTNTNGVHELSTRTVNVVDTQTPKMDDRTMPDTETSTLDTKVLKLDTQPSNSVTETLILDTQTPKLENEPSDSDPETSTLDTQILKLETQPPISDTQTPILDTQPAYFDTQTSILLMQSTNIDPHTTELATQLVDSDMPTTLDTKTSTLGTKTSTMDTNTTEFDTNTTETKTDSMDRQLSKLDIVSSKRAGYIDNSQTTSPKPNHGTTLILENEVNGNVTDRFLSMYEVDSSYGEINELQENKNISEARSRSQLVEDAIKEELLMEKTLNENKYLQGNQPSSSQQLESSLVQDEGSSALDKNNKSNSSDKRNISALYTVSPNYKPLKKLDVQHSKQFVRDPDDNTWRNESISSLGIVFKPKNASKSFTEVLKNKTTELSLMTRQDDRSSVPDLRFRLEKMAEVRKSKKKKINKFGVPMYGDYEENSNENTGPSKDELPSTTPLTPLAPATKYNTSVNNIWKGKIDIFNMAREYPSEGKADKTKKYQNADYYDTTDDYDAEYANLPKIDLKKFILPFVDKDTTASQPPEHYTMSSKNLSPPVTTSTYPPDRQATIQYFPPTKKVIPKPYVNDYDVDFKQRLSQYTDKVNQKSTKGAKFELQQKSTPQPFTYTRVPQELDKTFSLRSQLPVTEPQYTERDDGNFNRASYVIKHYKDFINDAAKDNDDYRSSEYLPFTEAPLRGVTMGDITKFIGPRTKPSDIYEYETQFRDDVVHRFVDNFNHNSERFKVDFPILFNNSVVHAQGDRNGKVLASSNTIIKRLYETNNPRSNLVLNAKGCSGNCEGINLDLSPAYELHYYVPDQEEKEEMDPNADDLPNRYKL